MVVIRLARGGAKKKPFYHVVVTDRRNSRDGRYIERLGIFNPVARGADIHLKLNLERINHWLACGAQPSERVKQLIALFGEKGELTGVDRVARLAPRKRKPVAAAVEQPTETA